MNDRYTQAILAMLIGLMLFFVLPGKARYISFAVMLYAMTWLYRLANSPGRLRLKDGQNYRIKMEDGCGFVTPEELEELSEIDGVQYDGTRIFKVSNGVDVVMDEAGKRVKEAGPGSWIFNRINGGGPLANPPDACWQ